MRQNLISLASGTLFGAGLAVPAFFAVLPSLRRVERFRVMLGDRW